MIRNILFDFDGTLVDSAPGIVKTMEQTFLKMRVEVPSEAEMRSTIGLPLQKVLQMLGQLSDEDAAKAAVIYRELMQASFCSTVCSSDAEARVPAESRDSTRLSWY